MAPAPDESSEWIAQDAAELAAAYLVELQDWQRDVLGSWLAEGPDGTYAAKTCGLLVPRQNGKSEVIAARILFGMLFANGGAGEVIAYSAHRVDATLVMFERLLEVFGDSRRPPEEWAHPELHALVDSETFTNGHQAIRLKNGSMVAFNARATGSRRSFTVDVQVYDEAGFLTDDQQSASKSTNSSAPHGNPQTIYVGTPPSERGVYAEPFARVKANALAGVGATCWHEWSVEGFERGMLSDLNVWAEVNPALGSHLLYSAVESELADMSPEKFAIERLCWWPETVSSKAVNPDRWDAACVPEAGAPGDGETEKVACGVKFAPDGLQVCVSVAVLCRDGHVHVELARDADVLSGVREIADGIAARKDLYAAVYVDGRSGADNFAYLLSQAGFPKRAVHIMRAADAVAAATMVVGMLADGMLTHLDDPALTASALSATKRKVGSDGYGFGGDCCALESAAAAVLAARQTKRNPKRKMRVL